VFFESSSRSLLFCLNTVPSIDRHYYAHPYIDILQHHSILLQGLRNCRHLLHVFVHYLAAHVLDIVTTHRTAAADSLSQCNPTCCSLYKKLFSSLKWSCNNLKTAACTGSLNSEKICRA
jgi:hypothetical protein